MKRANSPVILLLMMAIVWSGCQKKADVHKIEMQRTLTLGKEVKTQLEREAELVEKVQQEQEMIQSVHKRNYPAAKPARRDVFVSALSSLNNSGVSGSTVLDKEGDLLSVQIDLIGLSPGAQHTQHIRDIVKNQSSSHCPDMSNDDDGDGYITIRESMGTFGSIRLHLDPFPIADANGEIHYTNKFNLSDYSWIDSDKMNLGKCNVVIYGMKVGNEFDPLMPVACGSIVKAR